MLRVRSTKELWRYVAVITAVITVLVPIANSVLVPANIRAETLVPGLIAHFLSTPFYAWFVGTQVLRAYRLQSELEASVRVDYLTKALTREYFFESLKRKEKSDGCVLMVDVDHFKTVNDTYGHLNGDKVLESVAQVLMDCADSYGMVCRYGGEEFAIFLEDMMPTDALLVAENIRKRLEENEIQTSEATIRVTVSIGLAAVTEGAHMDDAILRADTALYRAKETGRNKVVGIAE